MTTQQQMSRQDAARLDGAKSLFRDVDRNLDALMHRLQTDFPESAAIAEVEKLRKGLAEAAEHIMRKAPARPSSPPPSARTPGAGS